MGNATSKERLVQRLKVPTNGKFRLDDVDPDSTKGVKNKDDAKDELQAIHERLNELQEVLYAQSRHAVLVVLQAMDTGGKDGTIRRVFGPLNPQGVRVTNFKAPTAIELAHDFLWRIHNAVPPKGHIGIFNRSHYEDVLIVRVHGLASKEVINRRYEEINAFEKYLSANGIAVVKFFLHISKDEQKERLQSRLDRPDKHWKFNAGDLAERKLWDDYVQAYERALSKCSTPWAPWYVIPANHKWYRDYAVSQVMLRTLEKLELAYPRPEPNLDQVVIPD
jgi:PPK2 family polyphosphate:nucleotide phosphotransferase